MNRFLPSLLAAGLFLVSCGSPAPKEEKQEAQVKSAATPVDPVVQKTDDLKKTATLGLDELAAYLPDALNKMKRSNLSMSSNLGYSMAHADYIKNSKTDIRVTVYDLAGEAGSAFYRSEFASKLAAPAKGQVIDLNGNKAIESLDKETNTTTLTYLSGKQVLVVMAARNLKPEEVREAAGRVGSKQ